jgi:hypothetical protein
VSILHNDTEFPPLPPLSCAATHYTPPRRETLTERIVLAVCSLSLFAAMGVIFAVGLSGCGGGGSDEEPETAKRIPCAPSEYCK